MNYIHCKTLLRKIYSSDEFRSKIYFCLPDYDHNSSQVSYSQVQFSKISEVAQKSRYMRLEQKNSNVNTNISNFVIEKIQREKHI